LKSASISSILPPPQTDGAGGLDSNQSISILDKPVFLIYRTGLAPTNGTSIELGRLLAGNESAVLHIQWAPWEGGKHSFPGAIVASDEGEWNWPLRFGRGAYHRVRNSLGLRWWTHGRLNRARLRRQLSNRGVAPGTAYVVCMQESDAEAAGQILRAAGNPPYLLHILDILHDGIREETCPSFVSLIRDAESVVCISAATTREAAPFARRPPEQLPASTEINLSRRAFPGGPLSLVVSGFIWADSYADEKALEILSEAIPALRTRFPGAEVHYAGPSAHRLPERLRKLVTDHGRLPAADYVALLARSHVAYVPVTHPSGSIGRFSVPSRISDYLGAGLPVIACTDPGTGIHELLEAAGSSCSSIVQTPGSLVDEVDRLAGRPERWLKATAAANTFAQNSLATAHVRKRLGSMLDSLHPQAGE
jgi:glycosyltransferase involved in cell wall biosynthesis